jgi:hypothetical protein
MARKTMTAAGCGQRTDRERERRHAVTDLSTGVWEGGKEGEGARAVIAGCGGRGFDLSK